MSQNPNPVSSADDVFDVRPIPGRVKHAQIFQRWFDLPVGQHFVLLNDHDPVPLRYQFEAEFAGAFAWEYLEKGPEEFRVKITKLKALPPAPAAAPAPAATPATDPTKVFDVRPIPGRVKHALIFQRWLELAVGDYFVLLNDHDPVPLRYQFEGQFGGAFAWEYLEKGPVEFRVKITKRQAVSGHGPATSAPPPAKSIAAPVAAGGQQEIDVRGLEPPEPLVRILDALEALPANTTLRAHTDREPCHLFGEAEQRGFDSDCQEQPDGSWVTVLTRG